jgi:hypothetical protein
MIPLLISSLLLLVLFYYLIRHYDKHNDKWPSLLGKNVDYAFEKIKKDRPELNVYKIPFNDMYTTDFRFDRVRIFYDPNTLLVTKVPRVG